MYPQDRPKHSLFSPSSLERRYLCAGSAALEAALPDQSSDEADSGTRIHAAIAEFIDTMKRKGANPAESEEYYKAACESLIAGMSSEELADDTECNIFRKAVAWLVEEVKANGWTWEMVTAEAPLEFADALGVLYWGTADVLVVDDEAKTLTIIDWKTGFLDVTPAKDNWQGAAYALAAMRSHIGYDCRVIFNNPRTDRISYFTYLADEYLTLAASISDVIAAAKKPNAPRHYGEVQCRYCKAAAQCVCPEFNAARMSVACVGESVAVARMPDELLAEFYGRCKMVAKASELIEAEMRKRIEAKGEVAGYKMKKVSGGFDCADLPALYTALGDIIDQSEFLGCCKVSVSDVRDLWSRKAKEMGHSPSLKAAKDEFMMDVANLLKERAPRIWIAKDKEN